MGHFDTILVTGAVRAPKPGAASKVKADCARRIRSVLGPVPLQGLRDAALLGLLSPQEQRIFQAGQDWLMKTCRAGRAMAADPGRCGGWPEVPPGLRELVRRYEAC